MIKIRISKIFLLLLPLLLASCELLDSTIIIKSRRIRLLSPSFDRISDLDPHRIEWSHEANYLRALFSTLVFYDDLGKLKGGLAEDFGFNGNKIWFKIRKNVKTIDGYVITAEDVVFSFKRHFLLGKSTQSRLDVFIQKDLKFKSIKDEFKSIYSNDNVVTFILDKAEYFAVFVPLLASSDFVIIPKKSINLESLKISDFRNTSGAYYLFSEGKNGAAVLKENPGHFLLTKSSPQEIELVPDRPRNMVEAVKEKEIDIVPTFHHVTPKSADYFNKQEDFEVYSSLPISVFFVSFSNKGYKRLSQKDRLTIGLQLKSVLLDSHWSALSETKEFFGVVGDGGLTLGQKNDLENVLERNKASVLKKRVIVDIHLMKVEDKIELMSQFKNFTPYQGTPYSYSSVPLNQRPDVIVSNMDSGFFDNISLLEYSQSIEILGFGEKGFERWLKKYINESDMSIRRRIIRNLHYKILSEGHVIPIGTTPYYAVSRKPWKIKAPILFAGTPLWMISYEP